MLEKKKKARKFPQQRPKIIKEQLGLLCSPRIGSLYQGLGQVVAGLLASCRVHKHRAEWSTVQCKKHKKVVDLGLH